jgi:alpha-tubulin suppressor-like RCC1 family protein
MRILIFRYDVINPNEPGVERVQYPVNASWLKDVALRDLALHERHAACVDARGDVYQWGDGFFGSRPKSQSEAQGPTLTLRGQVRRFAFREKALALSTCIC